MRCTHDDHADLKADPAALAPLVNLLQRDETGTVILGLLPCPRGCGSTLAVAAQFIDAPSVPSRQCLEETDVDATRGTPRSSSSVTSA